MTQSWKHSRKINYLCDMVKRYAEYFLCDAIRLAMFLGGDKAQMSDGIGNAEDFPLVPKMREKLTGDDIRFIRVEGDEYYEVAFVSNDKPRKEDAKFRNKSIHRVAIGREIKRTREDASLSLFDLAGKTNLREYSLERIEDGRWDLDISLLGVILDALGKEIRFV